MFKEPKLLDHTIKILRIMANKRQQYPTKDIKEMLIANHPDISISDTYLSKELHRMVVAGLMRSDSKGYTSVKDNPTFGDVIAICGDSLETSQDVLDLIAACKTALENIPLLKNEPQA